MLRWTVVTKLSYQIQDAMSYGKIFLWEDMSYRKTFFMVGHFLLVDMSYRRTCLTGGHILWEDISYRRTCLTVGMS